MSAMMSNQALRRRLLAYALGLGYVITLAVGFVMVIGDPKISAPAVWSAIGLNLIASAVFALIFATLSSRIQERSAHENVEELFRGLSDKLLRRLADENVTYMPMAEYPMSQGYDVGINRDIMDSFSRSSFFAYRGPSARYVPARIRVAMRCPQQVRVCMLNPKLDKAITRAASDTRGRPNQRGLPIDVLARKLQREIELSVVGLFDCRLICPIEISYMEDTMINRVEVFDDSVYISWYHAGSAYHFNFPPCLRFPAGSLLYQSERLDVTRRWEVSDTSIRFTSRSTDRDLIEHLRVLTGNEINQAYVDELRQDYEDFISEFIDFLRGL
ncbi:hypothetical protein [Herbidospora daliensis]|uniref:hypothetical protein n=1 Tax=Herbidospora daliensis TaxID=295585 RepID=UPI001E319000|nr:hypothetical protein [Herbidospora daliensis]